MTEMEMENLEKRLDERYVKQSTCNQNHREIANKLANDDKRIEIGLVDVVDVESEESRRACGFVAASLSAEGSLPTHGWQVALQVEVARSYLVAEGFQMWLSDNLLECLARQRDGELVTIWAIVDVHLFVCV